MKKDIYFLTPKKYREFFVSQMRYAGLKEETANKIIGFSYFFAIILSVNLAVILFIFGFGPLGILMGIGIGMASIIIIYVIIMLIADSRASEIETVLPDALLLMSANVRAGMTVDRAIWLAARPEFGVLEDEIKKVGARTMGGKSLKIALSEMTKGIKSTILNRTIKLLLEGIASGGELAHLLEETANNIRVTQTLKKEIKASVMTYSIFILFAAVIAAPFLFAISLFFVEIMAKLWGPAVLGKAATGGSMGGIFSKAMGPTITADELLWFASASLGVTAFFGSLSIGLIQTGKEKGGIKLIPVLLATAITILFVAHMLIKILFGSFFTL
jgi:flagellar protein FlaJ